MNGRYAKWESSIVSFDERAFRDALSVFPTGVAVVTAFSDAGERLGLTVSSFNSVSLSPPLVQFSVSRAAYGFAAWQRVDRYAVNILNEDQEIMSNRFARVLGEKWEGVSVLPGETGVPILPNVLVSLECVAHARHDGGDHEIFIGRVVAISALHAAMPRPLVFFRGRYGKLSIEATGPAPPPDAVFLQGW
jgi:flavin reductase (DIM6/NTAB) family NADH-FMN oxidoreductase RutF